MTSIEARLARLRPSPRLRARLPWALDVVLVLVLVAVGSTHRQGTHVTAHEWAWWGLGLAAPLVLRRRHPVGVFAAIAAVALAQWIAGRLVFADCALLFALYSVASTQPLRTTAVAGGVVEAGIVLAVVRWSGDQPVDAFVALNAMAVAATAIGLNVRHRRALVASLHERAARLEWERDQQGRLSAAAERSRIAREMHDVVAHNLSVMIALADGASYAIDESPTRARSAMQTASRTGRQALTEMRRLLGVLREDPRDGTRTPQPGLGEVDDLLVQVRSAGLPVSYARSGEPSGTVTPGLELTAYRIVQEALTNTLKHAGPGVRAAVRLAWEHDRLVVEVTDTGLAARGGEPVAEGGGLRGMRERAAVYDGIVEAGPAAAGGWRVRAELPLAPLPAGAPA